MPLLLNFGAPHRRLDGSESASWSHRDGAWVVGLHEARQLCEAVGERHFMVVRFTPFGAHLFLRTPMDLIANRALDLAQIDSNLARRIVERVGAATGWSDRFDAVEQLVAERVLCEAAPGAIRQAWRRLSLADGRVAVGSLAREVGCSHRHLIAQFRTFVGLPPKTVARVMRFDRAVRSLNASSRDRRDEPAAKPYIETPSTRESRETAIAWADIAADCGYADQAHLIKEFERLAGSTPARFLRETSNEG